MFAEEQGRPQGSPLPDCIASCVPRGVGNGAATERTPHDESCGLFPHLHPCVPCGVYIKIIVLWQRMCTVWRLCYGAVLVAEWRLCTARCRWPGSACVPGGVGSRAALVLRCGVDGRAALVLRRGVGGWAATKRTPHDDELSLLNRDKIYFVIRDR